MSALIYFVLGVAYYCIGYYFGGRSAVSGYKRGYHHGRDDAFALARLRDRAHTLDLTHMIGRSDDARRN